MKNQTVTLVNEWASFEENNPKAGIEDFCRYYLSKEELNFDDKRLVGGVVPQFEDGLMMKIIGRISKLNMFYANRALKGTELNQIDEFGMLVTIRQEKNPKKTEVIYSNLFELSSGSDMLNRLKNRGLIYEVDCKEDKRSKLISLTEKGENTYKVCLEKISNNAKMMAYDLSLDEKRLIIYLLKGIEIKFSSLWFKHRGMEFNEIHKDVLGK